MHKKTMQKQINKSEYQIGEHTFVLNPIDNGGEHLSLHTTIYHNGDKGSKGVYTTQELTLNSYGNSASFQLCGARLTPGILRKLADELEVVQDEALFDFEAYLHNQKCSA